jgi:hypothetical protein
MAKAQFGTLQVVLHDQCFAMLMTGVGVGCWGHLSVACNIARRLGLLCFATYGTAWAMYPSSHNVMLKIRNRACMLVRSIVDKVALLLVIQHPSRSGGQCSCTQECIVHKVFRTRKILLVFNSKRYTSIQNV